MPVPGDLGLIVASHGRDELAALRIGLEAELPYVGLVASLKRGSAVLTELRASGVPQKLLDLVDTPAGIDICAKTPSEVALSILGGVVQARRGQRASPSIKSALDPICGMEIVVLSDTPSAEHEGQTYYFCCDGCQRTFVDLHVA